MVGESKCDQNSVSFSFLFQTNGRLESDRDDVRQSVRGEFAAALDTLSQERSGLLQETADLRLRLAEARAERESIERDLKRDQGSQRASPDWLIRRVTDLDEQARILLNYLLSVNLFNQAETKGFCLSSTLFSKEVLLAHLT